MDYKWLILLLVVLSLTGSIAWAMPTPAQRAQEKLRVIAMAKGIRVNISKLQFPREQGCIEAETKLVTGYTLFRQESASKKRQHTQSLPWQVFKANGLETFGLPQGWCWQQSPEALTDSQLTAISDLITAMLSDVYAIANHTEFVSIYWHERGTPEDVEVIYQALVKLREGL